MASETLIWWSLLCAVSALNVAAWTFSVAGLRRAALRGRASWDAVRPQVLLSAGYVLGCGYRSVFPVYDVQRLCLVDSWLSSVLVGRSVATVAELCFAAQWALLLRALATRTGSAVAMSVSRVIVPLIALAELCSWYAVLTTSNLGHVFEESIWGLCAALLVAGLVAAWPRCDRAIRPLVAAVGAIGAVYVVYMFQVDVPMYWSRWVSDAEHGRPYLGIVQGLIDVSGRWIVSHRWADWKSEVVWMSLYFSVGVWLSIGLIHVCRLLALRSAPATFGVAAGGTLTASNGWRGTSHSQ